MSTYKSYTPLHFNEYIPSLSVEDFQKGLQYKQQQYDVGKKALTDAVAQADGLQVYRDQDKAYLKQRLDEVHSEINKYSNLDFSDMNNAYQVANLITPLYKDPIVLNAVASTANIQTLQKNIEDLMDKHPDKYAQINKAIDEKAINDYLSNPDPKAKFTKTTPTIYSDYRKHMIEASKAVEDEIYDDPITGRRITRKDPAKILALLNDEDRNQIALEMQYSGAFTNDPNRAREEYVNQLHALEEAKKKADPRSQHYSDIVNNIANINDILNVNNSDILVDNYNQHKMQEHLYNYAAALGKDQAVVSPERLQQNSQAFQKTMQDARILEARAALAWKMGRDYDPVTGEYPPTKYPDLTSSGKSGKAYLIDNYIKSAKMGEWVDLTGQNISLGKDSNLKGFHLNQDGSFDYIASVKNAEGKMEDKKFQGISPENFRNMFIQHNKPIGSTEEEFFTPNGTDNFLNDFQQLGQ